jgi:hypothetical protein
MEKEKEQEERRHIYHSGQDRWQRLALICSPSESMVLEPSLRRRMHEYQMTESGWDQGGTWPDEAAQGGEGLAEVEKEKAVRKALQEGLLSVTVIFGPKRRCEM